MLWLLSWFRRRCHLLIPIIYPVKYAGPLSSPDPSTSCTYRLERGFGSVPLYYRAATFSIPPWVLVHAPSGVLGPAPYLCGKVREQRLRPLTTAKAAFATVIGVS